MLGNRQGRGHGFADGRLATGRGAGRALALAQVQGDAKALVAVELHRLHFALAHRGRQPLFQGHRHLTGAGALAGSLGNNPLDLLLQLGQGLRANGCRCAHISLQSILHYIQPRPPAFVWLSWQRFPLDQPHV